MREGSLCSTPRAWAGAGRQFELEAEGGDGTREKVKLESEDGSGEV